HGGPTQFSSAFLAGSFRRRRPRKLRKFLSDGQQCLAPSRRTRPELYTLSWSVSGFPQWRHDSLSELRLRQRKPWRFALSISLRLGGATPICCAEHAAVEPDCTARPRQTMALGGRVRRHARCAPA